MQQIFNFIFKNSNRLLFLLLLGISLSLTIQSHSYHKSKIISSANCLTGGVYERINNVSEYLNLKTQNAALAQENAALRSILFNAKDTASVPKMDSIKGLRPANIIVSKVIHNSYDSYENYLTINSGSLQGVKSDMGVINSQGIVGIVDNTSPKYATVISLLNIKSQINAKIKKSNHFGSLVWNKIYIDNQTNYYTLDIKLFNDMTNLGHVYIIKSKDREEIINLEKREKNE